MAPLDHDDDGLALWIARKIAGTETEARDLVEEARVHAGALLAEYRSAVERVAHALLLQRELDGAEVASLIKGET